MSLRRGSCSRLAAGAVFRAVFEAPPHEIGAWARRRKSGDETTHTLPRWTTDEARVSKTLGKTHSPALFYRQRRVSISIFMFSHSGNRDLSFGAFF